MSNSQEQSLNEDIVFLPLHETSPEFLYSEKERLAVERLLNAGPEAFYSFGETELCFLSSEEVSEISGWAKDYHLSPLQMQQDKKGDEDQCWPEMEDINSTYFPSYSDIPAPDLNLGWPEKNPCKEMDSVKVYTSPAAEGEPSVRELIRRHLQRAMKVIAIVTDRLTDSAVIGDLHKAASRCVPVYIILNQRSVRDNFTLNRLRHPNMQVRVLGGKSFCSRTGRMVVGEMKDNFLLVDLQTVIHGSYSLTWTDAHLHRQLVTVLSGSVVDSFDREFRILFAASFPVPESRRNSYSNVTPNFKDNSDILYQKYHLPLDAVITNPPSPPTDSLLDWEEMGVVPREFSLTSSPIEQHKDVFLTEMPQQNDIMLDRNTLGDNLFNSNHLDFDKKRLSEQTPPVVSYMSHLLSPSNHTLPKWKEPSNPEKRIESKIEPKTEKVMDTQISREKSKYSDDIYTRPDKKKQEPLNNVAVYSPTKEDAVVKEETRSSMDDRVLNLENRPSFRKPVILRVPQTEDVSSLSERRKSAWYKLTTGDLFRHRSKTAFSELSRSMLDLSVYETDQEEIRAPVPRFRAGNIDVEQVTPALALMQKRNDNIRNSMNSSQLSFQPRERARSFAFSRNPWKPLSELEKQKE